MGGEELKQKIFRGAVATIRRLSPSELPEASLCPEEPVPSEKRTIGRSLKGLSP